MLFQLDIFNVYQMNTLRIVSNRIHHFLFIAQFRLHSSSIESGFRYRV